MGYATETQMEEIVTHIGNNLHVPQLVQHFNKSMIFDTEEKLVGQWIDGKPLYQKIVKFGTLQQGVTNFAYHGVSNIEEITYIGGFLNNGTRSLPIPHYSSGNSISIFQDVDNSRLGIQTESDRSNFTDVYVLIRYTKTTDSPVTYIVDDEYEPRVEHCDTFNQNSPTDVTVTFNLGSGSQLIDADELVLYQASSGSFVTVNTAKYSYTFTSIWIDPTAGFMNSTTLAETPMRIVFNKNSIPVKVLDFILPVILK